MTAAPSCSSSVRFTSSGTVSKHQNHGVPREAYLPAQCPPPFQEAWLSRSHEYPRRSRRAQVSARQGPRPSVRLIGRIRTRAEFERLRRDGRRVRIEPFWCSHLSDPLSNPPRVAFAISRAVGNAVTRNLLRRRLRAILTDLDIPPGLYLIGCRPGASELSFDQIVSTLGRLPAKVQQTR
jgi:ribonuclease P protein component